MGTEGNFLQTIVFKTFLAAENGGTGRFLKKVSQSGFFGEKWLKTPNFTKIKTFDNC